MKYVLVFLAFCTIAAVVAGDDERCDPEKTPPSDRTLKGKLVYVRDSSDYAGIYCTFQYVLEEYQDEDKYPNQFKTKAECNQVCGPDDW